MNYDLLARRKGDSPRPTPLSPMRRPNPPTTADTRTIQKQLEGYIVVPREFWGRISRGDHIRYIRNGGKFCRGSFVKCVWERNGKRFFQLETSIGGSESDPGYVTFPVAFEDISTVYRKVRTNNDIHRLAHKISKLESAIRATQK